MTDYKSLIEAQAIERYLANDLPRLPRDYNDAVYLLMVDIARALAPYVSTSNTLIHAVELAPWLTAHWAPHRIWLLYHRWLQLIADQQYDAVIEAIDHLHFVAFNRPVVHRRDEIEGL